MAYISPSKRSNSQTLGNLDGGSSGTGGADVRVQSGTGDFLLNTGGVVDDGYTRGANVVVRIQNIGSGAASFSKQEASGIFSFRRIAGGEGVSVREAGDSILITARTGVDQFINLKDTPASYQGHDGMVLTVDAASNRLVFRNINDVIASRVTFDVVPPQNAVAGDVWWNTTNGSVFYYYVNDGIGQWVETGM